MTDKPEVSAIHQRGDLMANGKPRSEAAVVRRRAIRRARERALNRVMKAHRAEYHRYVAQEMAAEGIVPQRIVPGTRHVR